MDPKSKKLLKLEAYVQHLEAENRVLRAELNKDNAKPKDSNQEDVGANEACQGNKQDEITQPVANLLRLLIPPVGFCF